VLKLAAEEMDRADRGRSIPLIRIGGICGHTPQAVSEAALLADLRYHAGLLSLAALSRATEAELLAHCRAVAQVLPIFGFYLQPAVGGRVLSYKFWREFAEIETSSPSRSRHSIAIRPWTSCAPSPNPVRNPALHR